jgi:Flp pilus assembly protein TadG
MMRARSAQNLVEFALVVVLLLSLVLGILEFGRVWMSYQVITNASREGARLAALPTGFTTADEVTARVSTYMTSANLDAGQATVTVLNDDGPTGTDAVVTVTFNADLLFLGPVLKLIDSGSNLPGTITLTASATMRNE